MKIAILGMGAVGGHFAARLAANGHTVSALCRGPVLNHLRTSPLELHTGDSIVKASIDAGDNTTAFGGQDAVIITAKAHSLPGLMQHVPALLNKDTLVVFAQNGIPWWYADGLPANWRGVPDLSFLDPNGVTRQTVPLERVAGGVIHSANEMTAPGVVVNSSTANSLFLGMIDDRSDDRLTQLQSALTLSGVDSPVVSSIRDKIWHKALLNMTSSVVCLITGCRLSEMARDDGLRSLVTNAYANAVSLAGAHGVDTSGMSVQPFLDKAPPHLPSIRQDFDRGRPVELDALVVAPQRFARCLGLSTPSLDAIASLAIHQVRQAGLYLS